MSIAGFEKYFEEAIKKMIEKEVEKELEELDKRIKTRVRSKVPEIAAKVMRVYHAEFNEGELRITVRVGDTYGEWF